MNSTSGVIREVATSALKLSLCSETAFEQSLEFATSHRCEMKLRNSARNLWTL